MEFSHEAEFDAERALPSDLNDDAELEAYIEDIAEPVAVIVFILAIVLAVFSLLYICGCLCFPRKCGAKRGVGKKRPNKVVVLVVKILMLAMVVLAISGCGTGWAGESSLGTGVDDFADAIVDGVDLLLEKADFIADTLLAAIDAAAELSGGEGASEDDRNTIEQFQADINDIADEGDDARDSVKDRNERRSIFMNVVFVLPVIMVIIGLAGMFFKKGWIGVFTIVFGLWVGVLIWIQVGIHDATARFVDDVCIEVDAIVNDDVNPRDTGLNDVFVCPDNELWDTTSLAVDGANPQIEALNPELDAADQLTLFTESESPDYEILSTEATENLAILNRIDRDALDETPQKQYDVILQYVLVLDELANIGNCTLTNSVMVLFVTPVCSDVLDGLIGVAYGGIVVGSALLMSTLLLLIFFPILNSHSPDIIPGQSGGGKVEMTSPRYAAPYTETAPPEQPHQQQTLYPQV